ncbi:glycoside hydrolase family 15 [uncultured Serinicoccus sp.]|uniref:glycoside hydrolase family 15 n=1 Tax=uncultured Serinicoccus sp. TaxID=735514 RepID=UPI00261A49C4|nr:glycoside hydrolase family 15 [uncultured Serinicoccus sp.]
MTRRSRWAAALAVLLACGGSLVWQGSHRQVSLHQEAVTRDAWGRLVEVAPGRSADGWLPLSADPETMPLEVSVLAAREAGRQGWLASGWLPDPADPRAGMVRAALADLHTLTAPTGTAPGAVLAGASPAWQYVWPRDASCVAVALARTGHQQDALLTLLLLQDLQADDGSMQARYLPVGDGTVPDDREPQEDGPGWALWAAAAVIEEGVPSPGDDGDAGDAGGGPATGRREGAGGQQQVAGLLTPLVVRSTGRLLDRLDPGTGLPRPSPDYWERPEDEVTLAVAATALMGLEAASDLHASGLVGEQAWRSGGVDPGLLAPAAANLRAQIGDSFGPRFPRHVGGRPDAAVTLLLPPFVDVPVPGADEARLRAQEAQRRPAGGVAPGAGWRNDGVSWTPQTALQAVAAAHNGHPLEADRWLDWLDAHRTAAGALPEKVLHDGDPAAVAPLGWTAALVLLAARAPAP